MKYRIVSKINRYGETVYKVQESVLGIIWMTVRYIGFQPPHPDFMIPADCIVNCVFSRIEDAEKCLKALNENKPKTNQ